MTQKLFYVFMIAFLACSSLSVWAKPSESFKKKRSKTFQSDVISNRMHGVWMMESTKTSNEKEYKLMEGFMKVFLEDGTFTNFQVAKGGATTSLSGYYKILNNDTYLELFEYRTNDQLDGNENELKFRFENDSRLHIYWKLNSEDMLVEEIWVKVTAPKSKNSGKGKKRN